MGQAPLGHDRAAARNDAGDALGGQVDEGQAHAGVDGEVIHALLGLLDQGVAVQLPGQVLGDAADLLQRLVDRHRADRHRRVADDPLARLVDVLAGGEIHHRVAAPADRPDHLLDFLGNRTRQGRVADVGVDLHEEVAADDHRLGFGMIDVVRDDGASTSDFIADEFRRDQFRQRCAKGFARMLAQQVLFADAFEILVFTDRDVFHLRGDDALARVMHLRDVPAGLGPARLRHVREAHVIELLCIGMPARERRGKFGERFAVAARLDPGRTHCRQAGGEIDAVVRIGVGPRGVVNGERRVFLDAERAWRIFEPHFTHRHANIRAAALDMDLLRSRNRTHDRFGEFGGFAQQGSGYGVHGFGSCVS